MQDQNLSSGQTPDAMPQFMSESHEPLTPPMEPRTESAVPRPARPSLNTLTEHYWWVLLIGILIVGAVFRLTGVNWDDEQHLHPDERFMTMVSSAIRLPGSIGEYFDTDKSPMNPYNNNFGSFVYGTAPLFVVRTTAEVLNAIDPRVHNSSGDIVSQYDYTSYWNIYLVGRYLSAILDLFTCAMVFFLGRRLFNVRVGLLGALLYAMAVLPIQESHFFTVDAFGNVPIVLAFWFTLDIMQGKRGWLAYILAGLSLGLAVASRINFIVFAAIIVIAALVRLVAILGSVKRVGLASNAQRTYSMDAGAVVGDGSPLNPPMIGGTTRTITLGPIVIEVETKPITPSDAAIPAVTPNFWSSVIYVGIGIVLVAVSALVIFRIGQPYAFKGFLGLNPKWLDDMKFISQLISGEIDYPPSHQWTGRAAYLFPLYNIFNYGLGIPMAFAAWAGFFVGIYQVLRHRNWNQLLLVLWIGGFFLYLGQQFVLVVRYYLPLYPFFALYAGFFVIWLWDRVQELTIPWKSVLRVATAVGIIIVVGYSAFWAAAFTTIYMRPVSRIAASVWMIHNIPVGSVIANEHWDDPLPMRVENTDPFGNMFKGLSSSSDGMIQNYAEDEPSKRDNMQKWLDEADYIVLSSNRLYLSIPRLPYRFPLTTKYYQWLFDGELGFDQIQEFTSYPSLFGITINDDSSDEAFTVYDHPKVLIFKKSDRYSSENTSQLLNSVDLSDVERLKPIDAVASKNGFRMSPEELAANYAGGTWSVILNPDDFINQIPVIAWLVVIWLLGVLAFPFTFVAFRKFSDRGYAFAKMVGVLTLAWLSWTLASYEALPFERTTMLLVLAIMFLGAAFIVWRKRVEMEAYFKANWKLLLAVEGVYLVFFTIDLAIRYGNPDLWHPYFGGEKPMDFAYLNAVIKTTYFPAYNPWFSGRFINYYYFGQLISATLVKLTGIVPEVAYNLLLPMFFGMTASGAFGVAYNLVNKATNDNGQRTTDGVDSPSRTAFLRPVIAGLLAACFILVLGNLGQVGVLYKGLTDLGQQGGATNGLSSFLAGLSAWLLGHKEIPVAIGNWYWTATRIIPDTINEFPFFTFVYADLHAHLMSLPFTLVGLGLAAHTFFLRAKLKWYDLGIIALVLGALRAINTWDYPTYLALVGCAMVLGYFADARAGITPMPKSVEEGDAVDAPVSSFNWSEWIQRYLLFIVICFVQVAVLIVPVNAAGVKVTFDMAIYIVIILFAVLYGFVKSGLEIDPLQIARHIGWRMIAIIALGVLFYWPYIINYGTAYTSVDIWKDARTTLTDYLVVHGIFIFLSATYLIILLAFKSARTMSQSTDETSSRSLMDGWAIYLVPALIVLEVGLLFVGLQVFALVIPLVAIAAWFLFDRDTAQVHRFLSLIILAALLLTLMVEVVTLKGDIGRMNTVFKFYLQAWVFFGVATASGLAIVFHYLWFREPKPEAATEPGTEPIAVSGGDSSFTQTWKAGWWGVAALLIAAGLLYPAFASWAKVHDRFVNSMPPGLNGLDYMTQATYNEENHDIVLDQDYKAIQWLRENIIGTPVIVEANTGLYHWGDRVSINTGLPVVAGWDWHTKQQYSLLNGETIDNRISDIQVLYNTTDPSVALNLLNRYGVSIIYVGPLEHVAYAPEGFAKWQQMVDNGTLKKIYDVDGVQIYAFPDKVAELVK